jgi:hypothetical protein
MLTLRIKRLGIALGVVATVAWIIDVGVASSGFVRGDAPGPTRRR